MAATPTKVSYRKGTRTLQVSYADGCEYHLPAEYLRVFSPSAEVRGHGGGEPMLLLEKEAVRIVRIEPAGRYALRLVFSDGHDTGLYSWSVLEELGAGFAKNWARYLERLEQAGYRRMA